MRVRRVGGDVDVDLAPETFVPTQPSPLLTVRIGSTLEETNRRLIEATLLECGNVKRKAAEMLGISLKTLYNRLAAYHGKAAEDAEEDEGFEEGEEAFAGSPPPPAKAHAEPPL